MKFKVIIVFVFFLCCQLPGIGLAQNKVVIIPLIGDGITCSGTLVGTRWCDNGDQTVTDMTTGLVWLKFADWGELRPWRSNTSGDYNDAHTRAGSLSDGIVVHSAGGGGFGTILSDGSGNGDWRLPTRTELYKITVGPESVRYNNMRAFEGILNAWYWTSSTQSDNTTRALCIGMSSGTSGSNSKTVEYNVWPVRYRKFLD